jgi:hypothetical protein
MTGINSYSTTASENVQANTGVNWDEGMSPGQVNNSARQNMVDTRAQFNDLIWFQYGIGSKTVAPVYASATSFTLAGGDATAVWHAARRVKAVGSSTGTIYGAVSSSSFASSTTTVNVAWDTGALANEALTIYLSQIPVSGWPLPAVVNENMAVNGTMQFDQENNGASVTLTAAAAIKYVLDQYYASCTGANITTQQIAGTGKYRNALRFSGATSNTGLLFGQRHRSYDCDDMLNSNVTHQWELSSNSLTSLTWNAYYASAQDNFTSKTLIASGTFSINTTPAVYSATFNAGANARNGICIELVGGALAGSKTLDISGYKLELGNYATTLKSEKRSVAFARCQEFAREVLKGNGSDTYQVVGQCYGAGSALFSFPLQPIMWKSPSVTITGGWGAALADWSSVNLFNLALSQANPTSLSFAGTGTSGFSTGAACNIVSQATSRIFATARL